MLDVMIVKRLAGNQTLALGPSVHLTSLIAHDEISQAFHILEVVKSLGMRQLAKLQLAYFLNESSSFLPYTVR